VSELGHRTTKRGISMTLSRTVADTRTGSQHISTGEATETSWYARTIFPRHFNDICHLFALSLHPV
jgi:hypothetical protein